MLLERMGYLVKMRVARDLDVCAEQELVIGNSFFKKG